MQPPPNGSDSESRDSRRTLVIPGGNATDGGRVHRGGAVVRAAVVKGGRGVARRSSRGGEGWVRVVAEDGESPELSHPLPMIYNSSSYGENDGVNPSLLQFTFTNRKMLRKKEIDGK
ncbi:hypothetical protein TIFTF001_019505 [Ficus carica]|uniref:Uncharacterized protein n=1 Tax=Ficus carica TaxID=3494 RepID=A0AA88A6N0_FICCA|nr:hypothetical protein TIFTF001_019505 [Ficus carica]